MTTSICRFHDAAFWLLSCVMLLMPDLCFCIKPTLLRAFTGGKHRKVTILGLFLAAVWLWLEKITVTENKLWLCYGYFSGIYTSASSRSRANTSVSTFVSVLSAITPHDHYLVLAFICHSVEFPRHQLVGALGNDSYWNWAEEWGRWMLNIR